MTTVVALKHYIKNPTAAVRRVGYKLYELTHPDEPWIALENQKGIGEGHYQQRRIAHTDRLRLH